MNIIVRFKKLSLWNKIGVLGALASIIALIFIFFPKEKESQEINIYGNVSNSNIIQIVGGSKESIKEILNSAEKYTIQQENTIENNKNLDSDIKIALKYYPSGYKWEQFNTDFVIGPSDTSAKLKVVFNFLNDNFGKTVKWKQIKEHNNILEGILKENPYFAYGWFYMGVSFSFISKSNEVSEEFAKAAQKYFNTANILFDKALDIDPRNPYLHFYKGMYLTHISKGRESVLYLKEALRIKPTILNDPLLLGMFVFSKHIDERYLQEWEKALKIYLHKDK